MLDFNVGAWRKYFLEVALLGCPFGFSAVLYAPFSDCHGIALLFDHAHMEWDGAMDVSWLDLGVLIGGCKLIIFLLCSHKSCNLGLHINNLQCPLGGLSTMLAQTLFVRAGLSGGAGYEIVADYLGLTVNHSRSLGFVLESLIPVAVWNAGYRPAVACLILAVDFLDETLPSEIELSLLFLLRCFVYFDGDVVITSRIVVLAVGFEGDDETLCGGLAFT